MKADISDGNRGTGRPPLEQRRTSGGKARGTLSKPSGAILRNDHGSSWRCRAEFAQPAGSGKEPSVHQVTSQTAAIERRCNAELWPRQTGATTEPSPVSAVFTVPTMTAVRQYTACSMNAFKPRLTHSRTLVEPAFGIEFGFTPTQTTVTARLNWETVVGQAGNRQCRLPGRQKGFPCVSAGVKFPKNAD
jgi:hypothetical protein